MIFQGKCFSCCILLTDPNSLPDCVFSLRYWSIYVLQLLISQIVISQILKLTLSFKSSRFSTRPKNEEKFNYLEEKI